MNKNSFAKTLITAINTILNADVVDTNTLNTTVSERLSAYAASLRKADVASAYTEATAALDEAMRTYVAGYNLSTAAVNALAASIAFAKKALADQKISLIDLASIKVSYEGTYTIKAKLVYTESKVELAQATSTTRFLEAKKALEAAGVKIPAADATRNEWNAARDAASTDELKRALNAIRGAYEDVAAAAKGMKKVHADVVTITGRKIDETEAPVDSLRLPKKMRSLHFYITESNGLDKDVLRGRFLKATLTVDFDANGRMLAVATC